jgi:ethanolamine utilization protein EutA
MPSFTVPVTIKSLVFNEDPRVPDVHGAHQDRAHEHGHAHSHAHGEGHHHRHGGGHHHDHGHAKDR